MSKILNCTIIHNLTLNITVPYFLLFFLMVSPFFSISIFSISFLQNVGEGSRCPREFPEIESNSLLHLCCSARLPHLASALLGPLNWISGHFNEFGVFVSLIYLFTFLLLHLHLHIQAPSPCFNRLLLFVPTQLSPARLTF